MLPSSQRDPVKISFSQMRQIWARHHCLSSFMPASQPPETCPLTSPFINYRLAATAKSQLWLRWSSLPVESSQSALVVLQKRNLRLDGVQPEARLQSEWFPGHLSLFHMRRTRSFPKFVHTEELAVHLCYLQMGAPCVSGLLPAHAEKFLLLNT